MTEWMKEKTRDTRGRIAVSVLIFGVLVGFLIVAIDFFATDSLQHARFAFGQSTATTTVTILNTPPNWTVDAQEALESSTSSPTNAGNSVSWNAIATDPNSDNFYLLICKTTSTPTAGAGGAAPTCAGGAGNQWGVSASTVSASNATTTYTTSANDPQINVWVAWICDNNAGGAQCNALFKQGTGNTASPFVVNHKPTFSSFTNNSPTNPGAIVTWNTLASDTDNFTGATDTLTLYVCKANDFTGTACGPSGAYCTSASTVFNPTCTSTLPIPDQDQTYNSFGYILDQHLFAASGTGQGATSVYTVSNVAPFVSSSSISLLNTNGSSTPLTLTSPATTTPGFQVKFTASDNNSCLAAGGGQEVASALLNVYRSGITQASCQTVGNYNPNNCYPAAIGTSTWGYSCTQDGGSCTGSSSITATWTCTFPLWYNADPTDGSLASDTQFFNQNWLTSVKLTDNNNATSALTESSVGAELASFLAVNFQTASINFGPLSPGTNNPTLATSTVFSETGNTGLNESLSGFDLCTAFSPSSPCVVSTTSTIPSNQIQYATSAVAYGSGLALSGSSTLFRIQVPKSTATSTQTLGTTFWGIAVPSTIQLSGAYSGQNTFIAVKSNAQVW